MMTGSGSGIGCVRRHRGERVFGDQHPRIFAIGDCAEYPSLYAGERVRLESVQNAVDQGTCVARTITGKRAAYDVVPWFWSDQFDIHLQMAGIAPRFDRTVTRGDPASGKFSVFYYHQGALKGVNSINRAAEHMTARKLIGARAVVTPEQAAERASISSPLSFLK